MKIKKYIFINGGYMDKRKKILVVIDMQNDFVSGVLGTPEAQAIVPKVVDKIKAKDYDLLIATQDTHFDDYEEYREGRYLPVKHCVPNTWGYEIVDEISQTMWDVDDCLRLTMDKCNFALEGDLWEEIVKILNDFLYVYVSFDYQGEDLEFEFCGVATNICVVSNAFALRQAFPEAEIIIDASCCAGTTPEAHKAALMTMKSCQMNIINE